MNIDYSIILIALFAIIAIIIAIVFIKKNKKKPLSAVETSAIIDALGGSDNIVKYEEKVSRLNVFVDDTSKVNIEEIKSITNCGVLLVNDKVQIILKDDAKVMNEILNDLKMRD